jgi:hypothetical protein
MPDHLLQVIERVAFKSVRYILEQLDGWVLLNRVARANAFIITTIKDTKLDRLPLLILSKLLEQLDGNGTGMATSYSIESMHKTHTHTHTCVNRNCYNDLKQL